MPALQGSPGMDGEIGPRDWSPNGVRGGEHILLPEGFHVGELWWNPAWPGEAPEPALTEVGLGGRLGRAGATFVPDVSRPPQPVRLSGPIQFVPKLLEFWRLEEDDAVGLLGFEPEDAGFVVSLLAGTEQFRGKHVRERIAHLFWIRKTLSALFRDQDTENKWLRESHSWLDDRAPMELLRGGSMEDLLLVRDYVDTAAGV